MISPTTLSNGNAAAPGRRLLTEQALQINESNETWRPPGGPGNPGKRGAFRKRPADTWPAQGLEQKLVKAYTLPACAGRTPRVEIAIRILVIVASYLLGSVPSAYIAGRVLKGIDIRDYGDGHVGMLNASQNIGRGAGAAVLVADMGKGYLAIWLARSLGLEPADPVVLLSGLAAVAGHCWPIYIGFRGGGGQATAVGVFFALTPWGMLITGAASGVFFFTGKITAAGLIMFAPLWLIALLMGEPTPLVIYSVLLPLIPAARYWRRRRILSARVQQLRRDGER